MNPTIEQLEAAIAAANKKLAELKAAEAAQAEKAWPQNGDPYWTLDDSAEAFVSKWTTDAIDRARLAIGNVFRTVAEAEHEIDRRKVLTELRRLARESWGKAKIDWENSAQDKWSLRFDHNTGTWDVYAHNSLQCQGTGWFDTASAAQSAVYAIGADRLKLLLED